MRPRTCPKPSVDSDMSWVFHFFPCSVFRTFVSTGPTGTAAELRSVARFEACGSSQAVSYVRAGGAFLLRESEAVALEAGSGRNRPPSLAHRVSLFHRLGWSVQKQRQKVSGPLETVLVRRILVQTTMQRVAETSRSVSIWSWRVPYSTVKLMS